jgi:cytochrome c
MSYAGIKDDKERADLIAYLMKQSDSPMALPTAKEAAPAKAAPTQTPKKEGS